MGTQSEYLLHQKYLHCLYLYCYTHSLYIVTIVDSTVLHSLPTYSATLNAFYNDTITV